MQQQNNDKIPLLVVCGPTASGKTRLAVDLAKYFDGEVVSADSMQIYRRMDVGTAKPTAGEMQGIPHHLLDIIDPGESFSLAEYTTLAAKSIEEINSRRKLPVLAGGTGLYIHSLIDNIQLGEAPMDPVLRASLEQESREKGAQHLWDRLNACDPELAEKLHPNNRGRVIRALEAFLLTGTPMSELQRRSRQLPSPYQLCMLGLAFENRETLYERINLRVDEMLQTGLIEEARSLKADNLFSKTAAQAIGYKELFAYLDGRDTLENAVEEIKLQTRRYAKRQMTWLRRDSRIHWLVWEQYTDYQALFQEANRLAASTLQHES